MDLSPASGAFHCLRRLVKNQEVCTEQVAEIGGEEKRREEDERTDRGGRDIEKPGGMRRFFRVHRNEDYSQIQYLTAKCNRLSQENGTFTILQITEDCSSVVIGPI